MIIFRCDRCNKEYNKKPESKERQYGKLYIIECSGREMDLCDNCIIQFQIWWKEVERKK